MGNTGRCALSALALAVVLSACSREVDPFEASDRDANIGSSNQLTFSPADDRSPAWSAAGDSVYYSTRGGGHLPPDSGVLVGVPVERGASGLILPSAQLEGDEVRSWLVAPALSPDGERLAFVDILSTWAPHPCDINLITLSCTPSVSAEEIRRPELKQIEVHVRRLDEGGALREDDRFEVHVPGVTEVLVAGPFVNTLTDTVRNYPFQQLFASERAMVMRPSWSPDGDRVVFSDGKALHVWTAGAAATQIIPGSEDGIWPAWSPDGEWIAFTRLIVIDSSSVSCDYISDFGTTACRQIRTDFVPGPHVLTLTRPDGSESVVIGTGDEPAWAPDGSALFFRRSNLIWRSDPDGGSPSPIPDTESGREPAVSPDGSQLAFAKRSGRGDYDIWVIQLGN